MKVIQESMFVLVNTWAFAIIRVNRRALLLYLFAGLFAVVLPEFLDDFLHKVLFLALWFLALPFAYYWGFEDLETLDDHFKNTDY